MPTLDVLYNERLTALPGVLSHRFLEPPAGDESGTFDALLVLKTKVGSYKLLVQRLRSHVSREMASHLASKHKGSASVLVLAPHIGAGIGATLIEAGVNYLDASGNCHMSLHPFFVHVEGKSSEKKSDSNGVRGPGFQVLFAYLAEPELLDAPLRTVAEVAGVSRQPVLSMNHRLRNGNYVLRSSTARTRWDPRRREDALALWLQGYQTTLRNSLLIGSYRTRDGNPNALDSRIGETLRKEQFRWGGTAAGYRLTKNYRGEQTVLHLNDGGHDVAKRLRGLPDPNGNLILMRAFGSINWTPERDTVHPLLVYSEMLSEGTERAREAAQALHAQYLAPIWIGQERENHGARR